MALSTAALAAFESRQEGAEEALLDALETRASKRRDAGDRAGAIALLEAFEEAVKTGHAASLKRSLAAS